MMENHKVKMFAFQKEAVPCCFAYVVQWTAGVSHAHEVMFLEVVVKIAVMWPHLPLCSRWEREGSRLQVWSWVGCPSNHPGGGHLGCSLSGLLPACSTELGASRCSEQAEQSWREQGSVLPARAAPRDEDRAGSIQGHTP